jgi:8-oxo-dGTP pyrophosphatase MutT (NUDIX family)
MKTFKQFLFEREYWGTSASGIVCRCAHEYLWTLRSRFVKEPMSWSLVIGGKIEDGESAMESAKREFIEETNYKKKLTIHPEPINVYKDGDFTYTTFLADVSRRFDLPSFSGVRGHGQWEAEDWDWCPKSETFGNERIHFGTKLLLQHLP